MPDVTMPQLGETVTEGTITRWMKAVGETVDRDEPLFEVSTDKVDTEVPSPASGVLSEILVPEGDTVEVGSRLAVIGDRVVSDTPAPPAPASPGEDHSAPPVPPSFESSTVDVPSFESSSFEPAAPPPQPSVAPPPGPGPAAGSPLLLSPIVRRLLADNGVDASEVIGTGVGGRLTREDVLDFIDARRQRDVPTPEVVIPSGISRPSPPTESAPVAPPPFPDASRSNLAQREGHLSPTPLGSRVIPFSNVRRRTAEHMIRSKATSPHAFIASEVDFENVERVRKAWGSRFAAEEGFSLTYLPFIARASVEALREFPNLNASVADDSLVVHQEINLGIAVDLDYEGLIVPVLHRAEEITLRGIARRIRDLADRARTRQLRADDIAGGTFSITNDGPFGTYFTVPIINQPQVAILATDGIKRRPVVVTLPDGSESIAIHSVGVLGMSWDHRAVDGAYVSSFLKRMSDLLTDRDWAAEL